MPVRKKNGRLRVVSAPQRASEGRRANVAPTREPRLPPSMSNEQAAMTLAIARGEVDLARSRERHERSEENVAARRKAERRARDVLSRVRARLGAEETRKLVDALSFDGGLALRAAAAGATLVREHGVRAILTGAAIARERGIHDTASLAMLGSAMRWRALAGALLDVALMRPEPDRVKVAHTAATMARLDLLTALQLGRDDDAAPGDPVLDVAAAVRAVEERHEREYGRAAAVRTPRPASSERSEESDAPDSSERSEENEGTPRTCAGTGGSP